jgi:hypothetical protein
MRTLTTHPRSAAVTGIHFILPFFILNAIVGNRIEPLFSLIRPGVHTSPREYVLLAIVLLLFPVVRSSRSPRRFAKTQAGHAVSTF